MISAIFEVINLQKFEKKENRDRNGFLTEKGRKKKFIADQLIKIMFYCNRWRTCGTHTHIHTEWRMCVSVSYSCLYWHHLNGFIYLFRPCCIEFNTITHTHSAVDMNLVCVGLFVCVSLCVCIYFRLNSTEQMRRVANRWQTRRNDDVCKENFSWWQNKKWCEM